MNAQEKHWKCGACMRPVLLLPALVVALSLGLTAAASAAPTPFQASVKATGPAPAWCPANAYACGTANIAGYGTARWTFYSLGYTASYSPCGTTYAAQTDFTLASDPSSTLVVDESGELCGLGHDGAAFRGYFAEGPKAAGHPFAIVGAPSTLVPDGGWSVDPASTGVFAGLKGSGTDLVNVAGFYAAGSYTGTLG